jgi:hypothetical protein
MAKLFLKLSLCNVRLEDWALGDVHLSLVVKGAALAIRVVCWALVQVCLTAKAMEELSKKGLAFVIIVHN